jgi:hypothetical protein
MARIRWLCVLGIAAVLTACSPAALTMPPVPAMTSTEVESAYEAFVESRWLSVEAEYPESTRPVVERVRFIAPGEMPEVVVGCLLQAGFDATVTTDAFGPALEVSTPEAQSDTVAVAWFVCDAQYPIDPTLTQPLSGAEIEYMYDYNTRTLLPCLAGEGFEIEAPSKQTYIESFGTPDGWYPYSELLGLDQETLQGLAKACPQNPPGFREVALTE